MLRKLKDVTALRRIVTDQFLKKFIAKKDISTTGKYEKPTCQPGEDCTPVKCWMDEIPHPEGSWKAMNADREDKDNKNLIGAGIFTLFTAFMLYNHEIAKGIPDFEFVRFR